MKKLIYTVGYGSRKAEEIYTLINKYSINCVVDIRNKSDNIESLKKLLNNQGIYYIPMHDEFNFEKNEAHDFETARVSENVKSGMSRIENGLVKGFNIVIMGEELDPISCNRGILISYILKNKGIQIEHIIDEEIVRSQEDLEKELLKGYGVKLIKKVAELSIKGIMRNKDLEMNEDDFKAEMIEEAYRIRYKEILNKKHREIY
ncbi:hypothetical protein NL50_12685 [Clostridium acetobutylicum]|nr:hypothetical protein NL50_12685 [Clostridium acetobutylicum]